MQSLKNQKEMWDWNLNTIKWKQAKWKQVQTTLNYKNAMQT